MRFSVKTVRDRRPLSLVREALERRKRALGVLGHRASVFRSGVDIDQPMEIGRAHV